MKIRQIYNGDWNPISNPQFKGCCDCGLVHQVKFRINSKGQIEIRVKVNKLLTTKARKLKRFKESK